MVFNVSETEMREAAAYEKLRVERDELVTLRDRLQQTIYKIQDVVGYAAEGDELVREVADLHQRFEAASFAVRDASGAERARFSDQEGLYQKFWVRRTDGTSQPGLKHEACDYLVLDWKHDPFAVPAARAYATACEATFPELAADLRARADKAEKAWQRAGTSAITPNEVDAAQERRDEDGRLGAVMALDAFLSVVRPPPEDKCPACGTPGCGGACCAGWGFPPPIRSDS